MGDCTCKARRRGQTYGQAREERQAFLVDQCIPDGNGVLLGTNQSLPQIHFRKHLVLRRWNAHKCYSWSHAIATCQNSTNVGIGGCGSEAGRPRAVDREEHRSAHSEGRDEGTRPPVLRHGRVMNQEFPCAKPGGKDQEVQQ